MPAVRRSTSLICLPLSLHTVPGQAIVSPLVTCRSCSVGLPVPQPFSLNSPPHHPQPELSILVVFNLLFFNGHFFLLVGRFTEQRVVIWSSGPTSRLPLKMSPGLRVVEGSSYSLDWYGTQTRPGHSASYKPARAPYHLEKCFLHLNHPCTTFTIFCHSCVHLVLLLT